MFIILEYSDVVQNNKQKKKPDEEKGCINELRIPIMLLFVLAAALNFLFEIPVFFIPLFCAIPVALWAIWKKKKLIIELLLRWKTIWVLLAPLVAVFVYFLLEIIVQMSTAVALQNGFVGQDLPVIFHILLKLREQWVELPVALVLAGSFFIAIAEEIFWRGYVLTRIMDSTYHAIAMLISSALFSVFYFFIFGFVFFALGFLLSVLFAQLTLLSRSLLPAVIAHFIFLVLALVLKPELTMI
jgi:membrane protease YdiL (CAAX protease family)